MCSYQFLMSDDPNFVQAYRYVERICVAVSKSKACSPHLDTFKLWLRKMKTPAKDLKNTDFLLPNLPTEVTLLFEAYDTKDEELADADLWTTESICFRYFNLLQEFKTKK